MKYSEEAFDAALRTQDTDLIVNGTQGLCISCVGSGHYYRLVDIVPGVIDLIEKSGRQSDFFSQPLNVYSYFCAYCGMGKGYLGDFEGGRIFLEKGLRYADQIGDRRASGMDSCCCGMFFHTKGDWKSTVEHLQNAIKYSEEVKFLGPLAWSWAFLGNAYSYLRDPETGRRCVEKGLKIQRDAGFEWYLCIYPLFLGDICLHQGDLKNAQSFMDDALRLSQKNNEKHMEAISGILLGRILGRMETPQIHEAEEYILKGMKISNELKLEPYYTQGHLVLGELYSSAHQKEKAMVNLKKAESMFKEMGMDYRLKRAQEALKRLGE